jgi:hypothetical protein
LRKVFLVTVLLSVGCGASPVGVEEGAPVPVRSAMAKRGRVPLPQPPLATVCTGGTDTTTGDCMVSVPGPTGPMELLNVE